MQLRVHNTLTRTKEVFEPIDPNRVRMYVCGPTVYQRIHVGNARAFVVFDVLYRLLSPYAGFAVVAEVSCFGAAFRYLGQLAATMRRWPEAEAHFDQALTMNAAMGAKPWLARTQYHYAQMLLARSAAGDIKRARILLDEAATISRQLGMRSLETRIAATTGQAPLPVNDTSAWLTE